MLGGKWPDEAGRIADYLTGPGSEVTDEQARQAIATAKRFIAVIEELIASPGA